MSNLAKLKERLGIKDNNAEAEKDEEQKESSNLQKLKDRLGVKEKTNTQKLKERFGGGTLSFEEIGVDEDYVNTFVTDAQKFLGSADWKYKNTGWSNASSSYDDIYSTSTDLSQRSGYIRAWLNANKSKMSEEDYNNYISFLDDFEKGSANVVETFSGAKEYYSKFKSEDDYNAALKNYEEREGMKTADLTALGNDITAAEESNKKYNEIQRSINIKKTVLNEGRLSNSMREVTEKEIAELEAEQKNYVSNEALASKKAYYSEAEYLQKGNTMTNEYLNWDAIEGNDIGTYLSDNYSGELTYTVDEIKALAKTPEKFADFKERGKDKFAYGRFIDYVPYMEDNEIETYLYFFYTQGYEKADEYLYTIEEKVNNEKALKVADMWDDNGLTRTLFGLGAGLSNWGEGVSSYINSWSDSGDYTYNPYSVMNYASGMVRDSYGDSWWADVGKGIYDIANSVGNMAPSIALSMVPVIGTGLSLASTYASSKGNAYEQMRREGFSVNQARAYGTMVGASEAGLQYVLGGISALGGKAVGKITGRAIAGIDNAIARVAIKVGGNMISEGIEEGLQTVLEPWFKSIATGVDFEAANLGDVLYSSLLGAVTAGFMEGGQTISGEIAYSRNNVKAYGSNQVDIVDQGLALPEGNEGRLLAENYDKQLSNGEGLTGHQLGKLVETVQKGMTDVNSSNIQASIEAELSNLGETGNIPEIAEIITKKVTGGKLSAYEKAVLSKSDFGSVVAENLPVDNDFNANDEMWGKIEAKEEFREVTKPMVKDALQRMFPDQITSVDDIPNSKKQPKQKKDKPNSKKPSKVNIEKPDEKKLAVSDNGKTTHNGEEVSVQGIAKIENGEVTVKLNNGKEVSVYEVKFAKESEAQLYEMVVHMGLTADTANDFIQGFNNGVVNGKPISLEMYAKGFMDAHRYGQYGFPEADLNKGEFTSELTEEQRKIAYNRGKYDGIANARKTESSTVSKTENVAKNKPHKKGKIYFDKSVNVAEAKNNPQVKLMEVVAEVFGLDVHFFESEVGGKFNGWYDPSDKTIHLDIHAGNNRGGTILFTASHELTHFIRDFSETKFKEFADFLFAKYGEMGQSVAELVNQKLDAAKAQVEAQAKEKGQTLSEKELNDKAYDLAYEEVVADACERMLVDSNAVEKLVEKFGKKDKTFLEKIKDFFVELLAKIKQIFAKLSPDSREAELVAQMKDIEPLLNKWVEALTDAVENYQASQNTVETTTETESNKFQLRNPVEETKDLVAIHNMTVSELNKSLDLGGLPMPSIAIIKAQDGHSEYGDVSLVFDKSTIDPQASAYNKVYGGDAWTPTYPAIEFKPNEKVAAKIRKKYYDLAKKFGYEETRPLYNYVNDLERVLNQHKSEDAIIENLVDDTDMMQLFLLDKGKDKIDTIQKETRTELSNEEVQMHEFFIKELGEGAINEVIAPEGAAIFNYRKEYLAKYKDKIKAAYSKLLTEVYKFSAEEVQNVLNNETEANLLKMVRDAYNYRKNGKVTVKTEADYTATKEAIRNAVNKEEYQQWLNDLFKGVIEKSGIRNNKNYYDNYGNARSWESLHWANNLTNVVKVMRSQNNGESGFFSGLGIWGVSAKEYQSIDDIRADKGRLQKMPQEEYNAIKEGFGDRLTEIASSIMDKREKNQFIALDNAMECIVDAVRSSKTRSGILRNLKQYTHLSVTETTVNDIVDLVSDISQMPTEYFEAKPQRAVGFDEVATAIIPDSADTNLKNKLNEMGVKSIEYKSGDETSRLNALNSVENVRFSTRGKKSDNLSTKDSEGNTLTKEQQEFFKDSKIRDENGNLLVVYNGVKTQRNGENMDLGYTYHFLSESLQSKNEPNRFGFFFTDNKTTAEDYSQTWRTELQNMQIGRVNEVYLNIKNPLDLRLLGISSSEKDFYNLLENNGVITYRSRYKSDYKPVWRRFDKNGENLRGQIEAAGYDGVIFHDYGEDNATYIAFDSNQIKLASNKTPTANPDIRYSLRGKNKDGIEVYETSDAIKKLSYDERKKAFLDIMQNQYRGRTAKFVRNGHAYYAQFEEIDVRKNIYGDKKSDDKGWKAKINVGANGDIFELVENAQYYRSLPEKGKKITAHSNVGYWDYFIKTVQIDNTVFDLLANVRKKSDGDYVYSIQLNENKKIKASPSLIPNVGFSNRMLNASINNSISQNSDSVNQNTENSQNLLYQLRDMNRKAQKDKVTEVLKQENAQLKEDNQNLKELVKLQRQITNGTKFTKTSVEAMATRLMKYANAKGDKTELANMLNEFYGYIASEKDLTWDGIKEKAQPAIKWLQKNHIPQTEVDENTRQILRELKRTPIFLDETQQKEAAKYYDSFANYRKKAMGSLTIVNEATYNGTKLSLDEMWQSWAEDYPWLFDASIPTNEQPIKLMEIINSLRMSEYTQEDYDFSSEMVAQDLLSQVYDSYWGVSTLYTVADKMQKKINELKGKHNAKLSAVKEYHNEKHNQLKKEYQEKLKKTREEYRERGAKAIRELMDRAAESRKKGVERRTMTELRGSIKKVVSELNNLLLHGTKERNIKYGLQEAVADALEAINLDTVDAENRIAKLQEELLKAKTPEEIAEIQHKIDFIRNQGDNFADKLEKLRKAYSEIRKSENKDFPSQFKEEAQLIHDRIEMVIKDVGNTPLRKMTLTQLQEVYDMYKMVLTTIRLANTIWREGKTLDLQQNASTIMAELEKIRKLKERELKGRHVLREFSWNEMTPYYAFQRIGSDTYAEYYQDFVKAQNVYARDGLEAKEFATATREKYDYKKWDMDKVYKFTLKDGRTFETTLKHMLSIYAYSKREQALEHMKEGGFFYNDKSTFRKGKGGIFEYIQRTEVGYKIDEEILAEIKDSLTKEQIGYVDEMQEYLTKMGEKGNEVTRIIWGIDVFKEKVYFPLKSVSDFVKKLNETAQNVSLKNDGMTKETKPGASNPIVLEAFDDVWTNHVERMCQYHAFVIPIDNLNKVSQYGLWVGRDSVAVSTMIKARHGSEAQEYIEQFIKDMNGSVTNQGAGNPVEEWIGKFKKTAVGMSLSTIVQQPTAILRATSEINPKYFVGKPNMKTLGNKWSEVKRYAPIALIKEIGGFDAGGGKSMANWLNKDTLKGKDKVMDTIDEISMKGAELADQLGWVTIWEAVKREVKAKNPTMDVNSEAFLEKCGERFTEVIVKTQVYDSTLSRSGYMRSKNALVKMATAFMGEPTLAFNMVFNAITQAMRGKIPKAKATGIIASVYLSQIAASVMSSFIYALNDDDEDESYWEKWMQAFGEEFISDIVLAPVTSLPFVKDAVSVFQGWDIERTDMTILKDFKDAGDGLFSENKSAYRKIEDFAGAVGHIFGIPVKNLLRTGRQVYNIFENIFDGIEGGEMGQSFNEGFADGIPVANKWIDVEESKSEEIYEAIINGDNARQEVYRKSYKNEDSYQTAIRKALRDCDPRIREAAQARLDGDIAEYSRIAKEIIAEGHFSQDTVVGSINSEITAIKKEQAEGTEKTDDGKEEATSIYSTSDINSAFDNGDTDTAKQIIAELIKVKVANGQTEKEAKSSLRSSMTSYWKELYIKGDSAERTRIRKILHNSGLYGTTDDVVTTCNGWLKK